MDLIVEVWTNGRGYVGRVLFEIFSEHDPAHWRNLTTFPGLTRIGRRGFGWWDWRCGTTERENRAICLESVAQNISSGGEVRVVGNTETCMILDGAPLDFRGGGNLSVLNGTGRVLSSAQHGFVGAVEWQAVGLYGRPAPARGADR